MFNFSQKSLGGGRNLTKRIQDGYRTYLLKHELPSKLKINGCENLSIQQNAFEPDSPTIKLENQTEQISNKKIAIRPKRPPEGNQCVWKVNEIKNEGFFNLKPS